MIPPLPIRRRIMTRPASPFCFFPANEDPASALDMTGDILSFAVDALHAWDDDVSSLEPRARLGLALVLEACRNDIAQVAERLDAKNLEDLRALMRSP